MVYCNWQDNVEDITTNSVIEWLGTENMKIVSVDKTITGYRLIECCDGYYGTTLNEEQFRQLIRELEALLSAEPNGTLDGEPAP